MCHFLICPFVPPCFHIFPPFPPDTFLPFLPTLYATLSSVSKLPPVMCQFLPLPLIKYSLSHVSVSPSHNIVLYLLQHWWEALNYSAIASFSLAHTCAFKHVAQYKPVPVKKQAMTERF
ncbi:hypothetical protein XENTR_v10006001 [Xenopus tropicalis]|nr:hypothetical protein XENTR_v10006001 [Xenopus tropicalis]